MDRPGKIEAEMAKKRYYEKLLTFAERYSNSGPFVFGRVKSRIVVDYEVVEPDTTQPLQLEHNNDTIL